MLPPSIWLELMSDGHVMLHVEPDKGPIPPISEILDEIDTMNTNAWFVDMPFIENALKSPTTIFGDVVYPKDAWFSVDISEDDMSAYGVLCPAMGGMTPTVAEVLEDLKKQGIKEGVLEEVVAEMIANGNYDNRTLIAQGQLPVPPVDGTLIPLWEKDSPEEEKAGAKVDFRAKANVSSVKVGQEILEVIRPKAGTEGFTVRGEHLPVPAAKPIKFRLGKNAEWANPEQTLVKSAIDGVPALRPGMVEVNPLFEVKGDVDFSVGNLNFNGTLHIRGNILPGFCVQSTGDIIVDGIVDAATVDSTGGSITLKGGVAGHQKALIRAKGDVFARYIDKATVLSEGSIAVDESVLHSTIMAFGNITVTSKRGQIIGGLSRCGGTLTCNELGAKAHPATVVQVGGNPKIHMEQESIQKSLQDLLKSVDEQEKNIQTLAKQVKSSEGEVSAQDKSKILDESRKAFQKTKNTVDEYVERMQLLEGRLMEYEKHNPKVIVTQLAHPGVNISLKNSSYKVLNETQRMQFVHTGDGVGMQPI